MAGVGHKPWQPRSEIVRGGEKYVYVGDVSRVRGDATKHKMEYFHEQGRKCVFVDDKEDPTVFCAYASKKFYPSMCKVLHPSFGKHELRKGPSW